MELFRNSQKKFIESHQFYFFIAIISACLYGTTGFFGMSIMAYGINIYEMLFFRFAISSVCVLFIYFLRQNNNPLFDSKFLSTFIVCGFLYAISTSCCFHASNKIGVGLSMAIFFIFPIFTILMIWLIKKQRINKKIFLSVLTSSFGVILISSYFNIKSSEMTGIFYAIIAAFSFALYLMCTKQITDSSNLLSTLFAMFISCSIIFYILSASYGGIRITDNYKAWFYIFSLSIISTIIPTILLIICIEKIGSTKASISSVFEPIFAILIGVVLLSEKFTLTQFIGLLLILFSSFLINKDTSLENF